MCDVQLPCTFHLLQHIDIVTIPRNAYADASQGQSCRLVCSHHCRSQPPLSTSRNTVVHSLSAAKSDSDRIMEALIAMRKESGLSIPSDDLLHARFEWDSRLSFYAVHTENCAPPQSQRLLLHVSLQMPRQVPHSSRVCTFSALTERARKR